MKKQPPIVRCFIVLCFGSAIALVALEWKDPFSGAVVTPASLANVSGEPPIVVETSESNAAGNGSTETDPKRRSFWQQLWRTQPSQTQPARTKASVQSPVKLSLSLEGRYLEVSIPGQPTVRYDVAVGRDDWQTPTGSFRIMN